MTISIKELRLQRSEKKKAMEAIALKETDDEPLNDEDVNSFEKLKEECDRLEARIARLTAAQADEDGEPRDDDVEDAEKRWAGNGFRAKAFNINTQTKNAVPEKFKGERAGRWLVGMWYTKEYGLGAAKEMAAKTWGDDLVVKTMLTTSQPIIPQDFLPDFVHLLQAKSVVRALGPTVYAMPNGNLTIPRQNLGSTGAYFGEGQNITVSNLTFDNIQMIWKKYGALTYTTRELLEFSPLDASGIVANDLTSRLALLEDRTYLNAGSSSYAPTGIINSLASGNTIQNTTASGAVTFQTVSADLQNVELQMTANLVPDEGDFHWVMHPAVPAFLRQLSSTYGVFPFKEELDRGQLNGHQVHVSTQMPTNLGASSANLTNILLVKAPHIIIGDAYRYALSMTTEGSFVDGSTQVNAFGQDIVAFKVTNAADMMLAHNVSGAVLQATAWTLGLTVAGQDSYTGQSANTSGSGASSADV